MTLVFPKPKSSSRKVTGEKHYNCQQENKIKELNHYDQQAITRSADNYNNNTSNKDNGSSSDSDNLACMSTCLTVWRKSLLMNCTGFTVINSSNGNLVYRVDNYCLRPSEIVLMDASGSSLLTMRRHKTLRLVDDWLVYKGDAGDKYPKECRKKQPLCYVKKIVSILQANSNVLAHVFLGASTKKPTYVIEGSYGQRSCKVLDNSSKKIVSEIKRKEAKNGCASFGLEVFQLIVWPGFDAGFAMALVLLLDQMFS